MRSAAVAVAVLVVLLAPVANRGAAQPVPPEDASCIREMSRGVALFTRSGLNEVLRTGIATGEPGVLSAGTIAALRGALVENCTSIPIYSDEGVCSEADSLDAWIDCVVALQQSALAVLVDAVIGGAIGPTPGPTVTVTPSITPTPTKTPTPPVGCAKLSQRCGNRSCCAGLRCVLTGTSREPICQPGPPPPPSASGAFLDSDAARFF